MKKTSLLAKAVFFAVVALSLVWQGCSKLDKNENIQKQKTTMSNIRSISLAIESYTITHYQAPVGNSLKEIMPLLVPTHIRSLPLKDGWGNDFLYRHGTNEKKDTFALASPGKDGIFKGWEQRGEYTAIEPADFNNDIINENCFFVFAPKLKK